MLSVSNLIICKQTLHPLPIPRLRDKTVGNVPDYDARGSEFDSHEPGNRE